MKKLLHSLTFILLATLVVNFLMSGTDNEKVKYREAFNANYRIYAFDMPANLTFAGEKVPLYDLEVAERLDRELLVNTYWQSNTLLYFKRAAKHFPIIEPILRKNGVPDDFKYLAVIESGFTYAVSPSGASGFWQFLEGTGKDFGLEINNEVDERYHTAKSTEAACKYFKRAYEKFGNWTLAAASFNTGMGNINKQLNRQKTESFYDLYLNSETSRYVFRIMAVKTIMENPQDYGFHFSDFHLYKPLAAKQVKVDTSISNLIDFAHSQGVTYKALKNANPWLRNDRLTVTSGKVYWIEIPAEKVTDTFFVNGHQTKVEPEESGDDVVLPSEFEGNKETLSGEGASRELFHKVKRGETLTKIAREYDVTVQELKKWNDLQSKTLQSGQTIKIYKPSID